MYVFALTYWAVLSFAVCLVLTPVTGILARRIGFLDRPDSAYKLHNRATPLGGGVALFASVTLAIGVAYTIPNSLQVVLQQQYWTFGTLLLCCVLVVAIGLVDDGFRLRGWHKLLGQVVAAAILATSDLFVDRISFFNYEFALGILAVPFTLFWLVGAINAINLLDGIDGLASSVGIVLSVTLSVLGLINGHPGVALAGLVLAGSLFAFVLFNFPPAKIYLGDAGSMLIGLFVGALTLRATSDAPATMAIVPALAVWTIPVFDTAAAIIRRKLAGRSIYTTDHEHVHHRLLTLFRSHRLIVGIIVLACLTTCAGSLLSVCLVSDLYALLSTVLVVGTFVATRCFGCAELRQVVVSLNAAVHGIAAHVSARDSCIPQVTQSIDTPLQLDVLNPWLTKTGDTNLRVDSSIVPLEEDDCDLDLMRRTVSTSQTRDSRASKTRDRVAESPESAAHQLRSTLEELTAQMSNLHQALQKQAETDGSWPAQRRSRRLSRVDQGRTSVEVERMTDSTCESLSGKQPTSNRSCSET